jgi:predicted hydrocarbon binding protein
MADGGEQSGDGQNLQTSFFIMPGNALKSLRDELMISTGEKLAEGIIYRYGIRCGEGMIQRMNIKCDDMIGLSEMLPGIWAGVGLGRIQLKGITDEGMLVVFKESIEAKTVGQSPVPACHFTRGYLSGMASAALSGKKVNTVEEECASKGDEFCVHRLMVGKEEFAPAAEAVGAASGKGSQFNLERGFSYILEEDRAEKSYEIFMDYVTNGAQGLLITRDYPEKIRQKYNLKKTPILWLSNAESEVAIEPVQLGKLYHKVEDYLKKSSNSIIMLSGIEYIITQNNYTSALKFLQLVRDQIAIHDAIFIVPISASTINERDLKMMEREMNLYTPPK